MSIAKPSATIQSIKLTANTKQTEKIALQPGQALQLIVDGQLYTGQKSIHGRRLRLLRQSDKLILAAEGAEQPMVEISGFFAKDAESAQTTEFLEPADTLLGGVDPQALFASSHSVQLASASGLTPLEGRGWLVAQAAPATSGSGTSTAGPALAAEQPSSAGWGTLLLGGLGVAALAGGGGKGSTSATGNTSAADTTAPTVTITDNVSGIASGPVTFTISFSEPVNGFDAGKISASAGSLSGFAAGADGKSYTVVLTPPANAQGTAQLRVSTSGVADAAGNAAVAPDVATQAYDTTAPTVTITDNVSGIASGPVTFTISFSEPVNGFDLGKLSLSGGTLSGFSALADGKTFTVLASPDLTTTGTLQLSVSTSGVTDVSGNLAALPAVAQQAYAQNVLQGTIMGGPVVSTHSLSIKVFNANSQAIASATVDAEGHYKVALGNYTGPVSVLVIDHDDAKADYMDEVKMRPVDLTAHLLAVGNIIDSAHIQTIHINPITTVAANKAGVQATADGLAVQPITWSGAEFATRITQMNIAVAKALNIGTTESSLISSLIVPTVTHSGQDNMSNANTYGKVLAILSGVDQSKGGDTAATIRALVEASTDSGMLNTSIHPLLVQAAAQANVPVTTVLPGYQAPGSDSGGGSSDNGLSAARTLIANYAQNNGGTAPQQSDYTALGISGIGGSGQPTVAMVNSALATAAIAGTDADSAADVQAIVNAYQAVLGAAAGGTAPSLAQLQLLGITNLSVNNLAAVQQAIEQTNDNGSGVDTISKLQALVTQTFTPTTAPSGYIDNVGSLTSNSSTAPTTDDTTPSLLVGAGLVLTPRLYVNGQAVAATYDSVAGTLTPNSPLTANTSLNLTYTLVDEYGNESDPSPARVLTVDTQVSPATFSGTVTTDTGASASVVSGGITKDRTLGLSGTAEAGSTVEIFNGSTSLGMATLVGTQWTFTTSNQADNTTHSYTARITDAAGNQATTSAISIRVDATQPTATIGGPADSGLNVGASGNLVLNFSETVSGTGTGNILIQRVSDNSTALTLDAANAVITGADASTQASLYYSGLEGGVAYYVTIQSGAFVDAAGNAYAGMSGTGTAGWDFTTANPVLGINTVAVDNRVNATENTAPIALSGTISGTDPAIIAGYTTLTVELVPVGGGTTVTATNVQYDGNTGQWTAQAPANTLVDGTRYNVVVNASGGSGPALSTSTTVVVDTTAPDAPTAITLTPSGGTVVAHTLNSTNTALTLSATIAAGQATGGYAEFYVGSTLLGSDTTIGAADTTVSFTTNTATALDLQQAVAAGGVVSVKLFDAAGNEVSANGPTLTRDITPPNTPASAPASYVDNVGSIQTSTSTASATDDATPGILVGANLSDTPSLYVNGAKVDAAYDATAGTLTPNVGLTPGSSYSFTYTLTDAVGNESGQSTALTINLTGNAPLTTTITGVAFSNDTGSSTSDFITKEAQQTLSGTLSVALTNIETVEVSLNNGNTWHTATATAGQSTWSLAGVTLVGSNTLKVKVRDAAGNEGPVFSQSYVLDTTAPTGGAIALASDLGSSNSDGITNVGTINVSSLEAGATWEYSTNSGSSWTAGTGTSFTLTAGTYATGAIRVRQTDVAGNLQTASLASNAAAITIDTTAPTLHASTAPSTALSTVAGTAGNSAGETITLTLTFDGNVLGLSSGSDSSIFKVAGTGVSATWAGTGSTRTLTYTVAPGQNGQATIDEAALKAALEAGLTDAAGNAFAYTANGGVIADIDSTALPVIDTTAPVRSSLSRLSGTSPQTPQVSSLDDGGYLVTWSDSTSDGQGTDIFVQRYNAANSAVGNAIRLQGTSGNLPDNDPQVTKLSDGGFVVAWSGQTTDGQNLDIFVQRFDASSTAVGSVVRMRGANGNNVDAAVRVTALHDGAYVVVWRGATNDGQGNDIFLQRYDSANNPLGSQQRLQGMAGNLQDTAPQIVKLDGGGYVLAWWGNSSDGQGSEIFVQRYDAAHVAVGGVQRLQGMSGTLADQGPQLTALSDGGHVLVWRGDTSDAQGFDIFVQRYDSTHTAVGSMQRLQGMSGALADVAVVVSSLSDGGYVVAWQGETSDTQGTDIFVQRYAANNTAVGSVLRLQGAAGNLADTAPVVVALASGAYVMAWQAETSDGQGTDIFVQRYNASNTAVGSLQRLQGTAGNVADTAPQITALADGGYAIAWVSGTGIATQRFDAQGNPVPTPLMALQSDTGSSRTDGLTSNGQISLTLPADVTSWQYSTNGGGVWTNGTGTGFVLAAGSYAAGQVVVVGYDAAGNALEESNTATITVDTTAPTLHASTAPSTALSTVAGTAGNSAGETITLTLSFDGNVLGLSSGSNSSIFKVAGTGVSATWAGTGSTRTLTYTVAPGQNGQATIDEAALKAALEAGLTDAAGNAFAYTANGGVIADIDATPLPVIDTTAPTLHASTAPSTALSTVAGTAGNSAGETITLTLTFDGNVSGLSSGSNSSIFKVAGTGVSATWAGTGSTRTLTYTVASGQNGQATIDEAALKAALEAGLTDAAGNAFAYTANGGVIADIDATPLPVIDTTAPIAVDLVSGTAGIQATGTQVFVCANAGSPRALFSNVALASDTDIVAISVQVGGVVDAARDKLVFGSVSKLLDSSAGSGLNVTINGISGVNWSYDTNRVLTLSKTGGGAFTAAEVQAIEQGLRFDTTTLNEGGRTFRLTRQDAAGNASASATETVSVTSDTYVTVNGGSSTDQALVMQNTDLFAGARAFDLTMKLSSTKLNAWSELFSYAVPGSDNHILLSIRATSTSTQFRVSMGNDNYTFTANTNYFDGTVRDFRWVWDGTGSTTSVTFFVDGVQLATDTSGSKAARTDGGTLVIAQDQDSVNGGFEGAAAFKGDIYDISLSTSTTTMAAMALKARWTMDDNGTNQLVSTVNGYTLTATDGLSGTGMTSAPGGPTFATPLVLDLNGDGVRTKSLSQGVLFDIDAEGMPRMNGWADEADGLLVLDLDRNGRIDNGSELFGSGTRLPDGTKARDGYQALAQHDANGDGVIDGQDAVFKDLQVWVDANVNGYTDGGELHSLASLGIASLDLNAQPGSEVNHGNILGLVSGWTDAQGQVHAMADVWFSSQSLSEWVSQMDTQHRLDLSQNAQADVLDIHLSDVLASPHKLLVVTADAQDTVRLDHSGWVNTGATALVDNHAYTLWSNAGAHLLLDEQARVQPVL